MQTLRKQMKQAGASVKVAKNRLAKIALEGTDVASIASLLKGPTVIAFSGDPVAAPKVAVDFAKANEQFVILGGSMGKTTLIPTASRRSPRCRRWMNCGRRSSGCIQAPATKIAQVAQRSGRQGRARCSGLCLKERSGVRPFAISNGSNQKDCVPMAELRKS